jgi:hypothetical protein
VELGKDDLGGCVGVRGDADAQATPCLREMPRDCMASELPIGAKPVPAYSRQLC